MYQEYSEVYEANLNDFKKSLKSSDLYFKNLVAKVQSAAVTYKDHKQDGQKLVAHILSLFSALKSKKDNDGNI